MSNFSAPSDRNACTCACTRTSHAHVHSHTCCTMNLKRSNQIDLNGNKFAESYRKPSSLRRKLPTYGVTANTVSLRLFFLYCFCFCSLGNRPIDPTHILTLKVDLSPSTPLRARLPTLKISLFRPSCLPSSNQRIPVLEDLLLGSPALSRLLTPTKTVTRRRI